MPYIIQTSRGSYAVATEREARDAVFVEHVDWITFGRAVRAELGYQGGGHLDIEAYNRARLES